ncbi:hypothetical protein ZIOFF_043664 [Zingiber officinale]|uniref:Non-haem dioxygenase N-terminal domain-containing protein n=1 Tax=Zingiber officinale TaxID=94328 RepID=A0A8J5KZ17_ZINOF|nr:hypothetical protein ZIOFF_043664 [Zingiber officinale]
MEVERVQLIASFCASDAGAMPPEFIRSDHEQPCLTTFLGPAPAIPVIDLAAFDGPEITRVIAEASREWGIFQVVGHGVPEEAMRELQRAGREFFEELPQEEKEKYARKDSGGGAPANGGQEGYGTKLQRELEGKKAWVDFFFHYIAPPSKVNHRIWPVLPATDYSEAVLADIEGASASQNVALEGASANPPSVNEPTSLPASEQSPEAAPAKKKRRLTLAPSPKQKSISHSEDLPSLDDAPPSPDLPLSALYPALVPSSSVIPTIPSIVQEELANYKTNEDTRFKERRKTYLKSSDFVVLVSNFFINSIKFMTKEGVEQLKELKLLVVDPPSNFPDTRRIVKNRPPDFFPQLL